MKMKLRKFYELIHRNATVTLTTENMDEILYKGSVRNIPDQFDDSKVTDFTVINDGAFIFNLCNE